MFINSLFLGTITGYDAPDAPSRIKRHDISSFPVPIINPTSKPNFGGWSLNSLPNFLLYQWLERLYFRVFTQFWKWCRNVNSTDFENTLSLKSKPHITHITQYFKYIFMLCGSYLGVENYHIRFVVYLEFWKKIIMKQEEITSKLRKTFSHLYFIESEVTYTFAHIFQVFEFRNSNKKHHLSFCLFIRTIRNKRYHYLLK